LSLLVFVVFFLKKIARKIVARDIVAGVIFVAEVPELGGNLRGLKANGDTVFEE
jgi:hypothetical protein